MDIATELVKCRTAAAEMAGIELSPEQMNEWADMLRLIERLKSPPGTRWPLVFSLASGMVHMALADGSVLWAWGDGTFQHDRSLLEADGEDDLTLDEACAVANAIGLACWDGGA